MNSAEVSLVTPSFVATRGPFYTRADLRKIWNHIGKILKSAVDEDNKGGDVCVWGT